ncbi:MAG TPA: hypothetical protein VFO16_21825 [Pseudonocardiaceae bacterium]|nr:hypothetical protein [Pseudonocardiaceae bacterium]
MAEQHDPQNRAEDAASPVPNRRERRGGKSSASVSHSGHSAVTRRSGPLALPRQYSVRRRSG